jgi:hypothetical protein
MKCKEEYINVSLNWGAVYPSIKPDSWPESWAHKYYWPNEHLDGLWVEILFPDGTKKPLRLHAKNNPTRLWIVVDVHGTSVSINLGNYKDSPKIRLSNLPKPQCSE